LTIAGRDTNIVGTGRATIVLPMGTQVTIKNALLHLDSTRILLSYRDIRKNGLYVVTHKENNVEFLHIIKKMEMSMIFWKEYLPYRLDCTIHT
jgi:hypothetical protein